MKLRNLSDFLIFDSLPLGYDPKNKIILTHLLHVEHQVLPRKICTIYTTKRLAEQFKTFCQIKNYGDTLDFVYLESLRSVKITLEKKRTIELLVCESQQIPYNLMVLIKENDKLKYLYAGNFIDIRTALLEDTFAKCVKDGVDNIYINLKRSSEMHKLDLLNQTLRSIEEIIQYHSKMRFVVYVPLGGCENFIYELANRFRKQVAVVSNLFALFNPYIKSNEVFSSNPQTAKIFVKENTLYNISDSKTNHPYHNVITINLTTEERVGQADKLLLSNFCYHIYYTPEPSPFDLQLLCLLCKPKRIYGIVDVFMSKSTVPDFLHDLCTDTNHKHTDKEKYSPKSKVSILVGTLVGGNKNRIEATKRQQFLSDSDEDNIE